MNPTSTFDKAKALDGLRALSGLLFFGGAIVAAAGLWMMFGAGAVLLALGLAVAHLGWTLS